ncbi:class I SAM-dependent methyltransferase [Kitasatospora nipponensis]
MRELPALLATLGPVAPTSPTAAVAPVASAVAAAVPAGAAGYAEQADALAEQYESVTFEQVHAGVRHLLPAAPARVLDVGAGTGRDGAALARLGHTVTAAEPTAELRAHGRRLHADAAVRWTDDALPALPGLSAADERYDLILVCAVWMHLAAAERAAVLPAIAALLAPGGTLLISLRHGPLPAGRRMFDVPAAEPVAQAGAAGLRLVHRGERPDPHGRPGVRWTDLALVGAERPAG